MILKRSILEVKQLFAYFLAPQSLTEFIFDLKTKQKTQSVWNQWDYGIPDCGMLWGWKEWRREEDERQVKVQKLTHG